MALHVPLSIRQARNLHGPRTESRPSVTLRLRVWWHSGELDRRLAEGANPFTDEERALRARQLTGPHTRRTLASGIGHRLADAGKPTGCRTPVVWINAEQVREARADLCALRDALHDAPDPPPRGVAIVSFLLCDPDSPLYNRGCPVSVRDLARTARAELRHPSPWNGWASPR